MIEWVIVGILLFLIIVVILVFAGLWFTGKISGPTGTIGPIGPTGASGSGGVGTASSFVTLNSSNPLIDNAFIFFGEQLFTEALGQIIMPQAAILSDLVVAFGPGNFPPNGYEFTVRVNQQNSALNVRLAGSLGSNTTTRVPVNIGDKVSVIFTNYQGGTPTVNAMITFKITPI